MSKFTLGFLVGLLSFYLVTNGLFFYTSYRIERCAKELDINNIAKVAQCIAMPLEMEQTINYLMLYPIHALKGR